MLRRVARGTGDFDASINALVRARALPARLDALAEVISHLYGVCQKVPCRELARRARCPLALNWFLANYGRHPRLRGRFNRVASTLSPYARGVMPLITESAGSFFLGYRPGGADPQVLGNIGDPDAAGDWSRDRISVSQALAAHVLFEFAYCSRHSVQATRATAASLRTAAAGLTPVPLGWRTAWDLNLWAGRGVVVAGLPNGPRRGKRGTHDWTIIVAGRRRRDLAYLDPILSTWDLDT